MRSGLQREVGGAVTSGRSAAGIVLSFLLPVAVHAADILRPSESEGESSPVVAAEEAALDSEGPAPAETVPDTPPAADPDTAERARYQGPHEDQVFFEAYWHQGIKYRLLGQLKIVEEGHLVAPYLAREPLVIGELGVKFHVDGAAYVEGGGMQQLDDKVDIRRSFLIARGTFFNFVYPVRFSIEMGSIRTSFFVNQGFLQLDAIPYIGSFRIGQYTAPHSFESVMNSRDIGFMEAAAPVQAFSAGILAGVRIGDSYADSATTWAFGIFTDGQDGEVGDASKDFARAVGRTTWVPWRSSEAEEAALVHVGMGLSYLFSTSESVRYQSRPESFLAPFAIDTDFIDAAHAAVVNLEAAFIWGGLSGQFEYFHANVGGGSDGTVNFPGVYMQLNGFMTGESRSYDYANGVFGQVLPHRPLSIRDRTWGAWEWGGRFSYTDLDDGVVRGGRMHCLSGGLNWYWNRYLRMQFDYVLALVDDGLLDGRLNTFQMRFQLVL